MLKRVTSIVISLHLFFIVILLFTHPRAPIQRTHHVKTRIVRPPAVAVVPKSFVSTPRPAPPKKAPQSKPKPPVKKEAPAPKPVPSAKKTSVVKKPAVIEKSPVVKVEKPQKEKTVKKEVTPQTQVWEEIDRALAKIEMKSDVKEKLALPPPLKFSEGLPFDGKDSDESIQSMLVGFLQETLHLPEIGEVKIQLTVEPDGTISKAEVVSAESQKNKQYLLQHLPKLKLPLHLEQKKTWTLTFSNEI